MLWVTNSTVLRVRQPQRLEIDAHLLARQRVERAERLIHDQQRRIMDQRAHDRGALAHAARQFAWQVGDAKILAHVACLGRIDVPPAILLQLCVIGEGIELHMNF